MEVINSEYFSSYKKNGCVIEQMQYNYDCILDCYQITFVFNDFVGSRNDNSDHRIRLKVFNPSNIFIYHIENLNQICELEMIDHISDGYSLENRYYIHDIEDEQFKLFFSDYEIETIDYKCVN